MAIIHLNMENFNDAISSNETIVVDFYANWCGPCRMLGEVLEEINRTNPDVVIGKVNVDENRPLAMQFNVRSIPQLYVFKNGQISYENMDKLVKAVGRENLVLDLSCRKKEGQYYIVTDRWQNYTDVILNEKSLDYFSEFCEEFLIHAVDVEGKASGIEEEVALRLGNWGKLPITYAGGIHSYDDLESLKFLGKNKIDFTIGSALDLFGGCLKFEKISRMY